MWLRGHSKSLKLVPFERLGAVFLFAFYISLTVAVSVAVCKIFSVKEYDTIHTIR